MIEQPQLTDLCEECNHPIGRHDDKYGCEYERGDAWVEGNNCGGVVAQGPCGCTAWTVEDIARIKDYVKFMAGHRCTSDCRREGCEVVQRRQLQREAE